MITTTLTGLVFSAIEPRQMPKYQFDPAGYIRDLTALNQEASYTTAVVQHVEQVAEKGREFISDVIEVSSWYQPPLGGKIDTWA